MKKITFLAILIMVFLIGSIAMSTIAKSEIQAGSVFKVKKQSTVYYLGEDGARYVFFNAKVFYSWFDNFDDVIEIESDELSEYDLGDNVSYKPGVLLVKTQNNRKVYTVSQGGVLHWLKNENVAKRLYGENWNLLIDDIPESFFFSYQIGDPIDDEDEYNPDEEEIQTPSISHNFRFKHQDKTKKIISNNQSYCNRLEKNINKIQQRLSRIGIQAEIGQDYLDQCLDVENNLKNNKVVICHFPPGNQDDFHTITVSTNALKAHLAHGDTIGACEGDQPDDDQDVTSPVISNISFDVDATSTIITWDTDEDSDSEVGVCS